MAWLALIPGLLPLGAYVAIAFLLWGRTDWRMALLAAAVIYGALLALSTEVLGWFGWLSRGWLIVFWIFANAAFFLAWRGSRAVSRPPGPNLHALRGAPVAAGLVSLMVIGGLTALTAVIAPPNTTDSMTYHMARVAHWVVQHSVADYPTNILRQLYQPPWAEYQVLHLQILTGGDHLANLVQWMAMAGSVVAVSAIAAELGAGVAGQLVAAAFAAALPMGIVQASSTQNDLVVSFWLACCVLFALRLRHHPRLLTALLLGTGLGLAVLTKGTALILGVPLLGVLAAPAARQFGRRVWQPVLIVAGAVIVLNLGFWARNQVVFGTPLGPETARYANAAITPQILASNVVRDVASQIQIGRASTPFNAELEQAIEGFHHWLGIGVSDPRDTWEGTSFHVLEFSTNEDWTANSLALLVTVIVAAALLAVPRLRQRRLAVLYLAGVVGAAVLFALALRWQPWNNRLELPLFVLVAPLCGLVVGSGPGALSAATIVLLTVCAFPWLGFNATRPLLGDDGNILHAPRLELYFIKRPSLQQPYQEAAALIRSEGCERVGFLGGRDAWEYPLWVVLDPDARVMHVLVSNPSAAGTAQPPAPPCAIVAVDMAEDASSLAVSGITYSRTQTFGPVTVFSP
jgi:hypothetical protein